MLSAAGFLVAVLFLDIVLSGDNAVVIAMTANGLPVAQRNRAIAFGMTLALALRVAACVGLAQLMHFQWIGLAGGVVLLWVSWNLFNEIRSTDEEEDSKKMAALTFVQALLQITLADLSMSIDNVVAVASMAKDHPVIMAIGLVGSILILGVASKLVSVVMEKHKWLNWVGLTLIVMVAVKMIYENRGVVL